MEIKNLKAASWVFLIFSFLGLIICGTLSIIFRIGEALDTEFIIIGLVLFELFGICAHIMANKCRIAGGKCTFVWVVSFLPFLAPFIVLLALYIIFKFIDTVLWGLTNRHLLSEWTAFIWKCISGKGTNKNSTSEEADDEGEDRPVYYVLQNGFKRTLTFYEMRTDYAYREQPVYYRYRDDLGNFWRSYDKNQHFVSEKTLKARGHKDIELQ